MNISPIIKKDYLTVSSKEDMASIAKNLLPGHYLVVLGEKRSRVGLITYTDYLKNPNGKVADCNFGEFKVSPEFMINETLNLMASSGKDALPVFKDDVFEGVVTSFDLSQFLISELDRYKLVFQKVAHDIRNPISNIIGLNGMLEENLQKPENIELLEMTKGASLHALDILSELLFIERQDSEQIGLEITELNGFIRECLDYLKGIYSPKNIELVSELPNEAFFYPVDRLQLKRTIHNIASNAIKFSNPGSKIHVSRLVFAKHFTLKICDSGIGIPLNIQAHVFDKFTHSSRPGTNGEKSTGLGLYFAKTCIERLRGKIWFESTEGEGTTFFIEFTA
ncbi:ATP-binding protein [Pedobacter jamesrossensis]|uniref:histidine kinase n=1 Tax=Pedobacter jamesrossensis TaxID=1908238 RepID=A0ABV8NKX5_9SPHI